MSISRGKGAFHKSFFSDKISLPTIFKLLRVHQVSEHSLRSFPEHKIIVNTYTPEQLLDNSILHVKWVLLIENGICCYCLVLFCFKRHATLHNARQMTN